MRKSVIIFAILFTIQFSLFACPVCERNQPKVLKGIVHGAGPESNWDYVGGVVTGVIALFTLIYSVKWIVKPGEKNPNHIKYSILN